jgi:site-specific DNA-methyltransferase (adenine-specific)
MFPEELPRRLIKMFSFVGDTVLDPFLGSGTTSLAAKNLARNSIGYEINEDFLPIIKDKLEIQKESSFQQAGFEIIKQEEYLLDYKENIMELPYIFRDPVKFDKKVDPRKLRFGSKIDSSNNHEREAYYSVKKVLSPELIVLDNGIKFRLLGVKEKKETNGEAINFLLAKLKGEKVFIKYDSIKYDEAGNLLCYLYLQNKTFINAHLIKTKLADVDTSIDYKYKSRFIQLRG